ncbi:hypothetical protein GCM10025868_38200 [Angustibacter aerolatus]|uniref:ABC transporter domain-containing protein n=1 Tax=Angustibacter aerolatus TaxID=1162965 RepID=A0ABQ6JPA9_9ACTN|nr:ATP-binding cassette domain-containing protein [Angustibacter aerolatus]GMA88570.1 hypothetical protein GCM10025868_38200 [Angustibacter aerolatus]
MVFQGHNLFPHLSVLDNVTAGPLLVQGRDRTEAREEATRLLARVGLAGKESSTRTRLSGGQQQRVGIARALAIRPEPDALRRADVGARPRAWSARCSPSCATWPPRAGRCSS